MVAHRALFGKKFWGGTFFGFGIGVCCFFLFWQLMSIKSTVQMYFLTSDDSYYSTDSSLQSQFDSKGTADSFDELIDQSQIPMYLKKLGKLFAKSPKVSYSADDDVDDELMSFEPINMLSSKTNNTLIVNKTKKIKYSQTITNLTKHINNFAEFIFGASKGINIIPKKQSEIDEHPVKNIISFIAGIEGSGHHLWLALLQAMSKISDSVITDLYSQSNLATALQRCWMNKIKAACNNVKKELKKLQTEPYQADKRFNGGDPKLNGKIILKNNSLLHLRSYSFPFKGLKLSNFPNIVQLPQLVQDTNILSQPFDLRIIVMKRNWIECLVSSCIHRFGACEQRVEYLPLALRLLQSQLMAIDPRFWIMIDYNDFMHRPMEYIPIVTKFLSINETIVTEGFKVIDKKKIDQNKILLTDEARTAKALSELRNHGVKEKALREFYREYNKNQFFLFNSDHFVVTPENTAFLDSKFN